MNRNVVSGWAVRPPARAPPQPGTKQPALISKPELFAGETMSQSQFVLQSGSSQHVLQSDPPVIEEPKAQAGGPEAGE